MKKRIMWTAIFAAAAGLFFFLDRKEVPVFRLSQEHSLWHFLAIVFALLTLRQILAFFIRLFVFWKKGPEGEVRMLTAFLSAVIGLCLLISFIYSLGLLKTIGVVAAGFAGMLLGWSLQAPVSGLAAWTMINVMRPFRVSDRVLFPSLGLTGDVKRVGLMYTVLNQVGGAVGSEEPIGRDILIPNAMLFSQVAINYTPKAMSAYFLDEVVVRMTYDSDWDEAEEIMLKAAREVTEDIIKATGQEPYIRSDIWDYGILLRLRYMTLAKDRPRITHEIVKRIFKEVQANPKVDMAIPFIYSFRKGSAGVDRRLFPEPETTVQEIPIERIDRPWAEGAVPPDEEKDIRELMENIRRHGLLQPIVVTPTSGGRYSVLAGEQRLEACRRLGWKTIPAMIRS
ncbi:MAG: mechanosensitive ion channel [Kiritimatiellae bacterium]|nr:mechanosensitive ion channel [Kiritimatiellia bacterium]